MTRPHYQQIADAEYAARMAENYERVKKRDEGRGDWILKADVHPMTNISGRKYMTVDGRIGIYDGLDDRAEVYAWFFPYDFRADELGRNAENYERVNGDHMPPDEMTSLPQMVLHGLCLFLLGLLVVLFVAFALAQLAG